MRGLSATPAMVFGERGQPLVMLKNAVLVPIVVWFVFFAAFTFTSKLTDPNRSVAKEYRVAGSMLAAALAPHEDDQELLLSR